MTDHTEGPEFLRCWECKAPLTDKDCAKGFEQGWLCEQCAAIAKAEGQ